MSNSKESYKDKVEQRQYELNGQDFPSLQPFVPFRPLQQPQFMLPPKYKVQLTYNKATQNLLFGFEIDSQFGKSLVDFAANAEVLNLDDRFVDKCLQCIHDRKNVIIHVPEEPKVLIKEKLNSYCIYIVNEIIFRFDTKQGFDEFNRVFHFDNAKYDTFLYSTTLSLQCMQFQDELSLMTGLNCAPIVGDVTLE